MEEEDDPPVDDFEVDLEAVGVVSFAMPFVGLEALFSGSIPVLATAVAFFDMYYTNRNDIDSCSVVKKTKNQT